MHDMTLPRQNQGSPIRRRTLGLIVLCVAASSCGPSNEPSSVEPQPTVEVAQTTADAEKTDATQLPTEDLSALVDVSIDCDRGSQLTDLPFDPSGVSFLADAPDETAWTTQVVTISNRSESEVAVAPGFMVNYRDNTGSLIGRAAFIEPFPPAFAAKPGQTIRRNIVRFAVPGLVWPVPDAALAGQLFLELDSCEIAGGTSIVRSDFGALIDTQLGELAELIDCQLDGAASRYEATLNLTNPQPEPITVQFSFEILDTAGNRLGIGGNESDTIPGTSEASIIGWAAEFTVVDINQAETCSLLALTAN